MNSSLSRRPSQARWPGVMSFSLAGDRRIPRATRQVRGHHRIVVIRRTGTTRDGMGSRRHPTSTDGRWSARVLSELAGQRGCLILVIGDRRSARAGLARADLAGPAHPAHSPADEPARRRASGVHRRDLPPRLQQLRLAGELAEVRAPAGALATSADRYPRRGTCKDGFTIAGTSRHVQDRSCRAVTASRHSGALCGPRRCGHRSRCVQWPIRRSSMPLPEPPGKGARHEAIPLTGELSPGQRSASPAP